jgi:hypothetical protein
MDAAARLRYVTGVQQRTRRAALAPSLALLALGGIVLVHGVLTTVWPHAALVSAVWIAGAIAARPALRWLRHRLAQRRGLHGSPRLRLVVGAVGLATAAAAVALGAAPIISAIAAGTAVSAYLAGMPSIAAAAVLVGAIADVAVAEDLTPAAGEIVFGAGLIAVGLVARARERA